MKSVGFDLVRCNNIIRLFNRPTMDVTVATRVVQTTVTMKTTGIVSTTGNEEVELLDTISSVEATKRYSLADTFDLTHFKDYQTRIIDAVIEKRDTLVVQPTDSGKSLCFQFPAVYTRKLSLVVSPTISLMQDQTLQLQARGISAMYLGSAQMDPQAESKVFSPDSNVSVLFVSPEWLFQNDDTNLRKVQKMREAGRMGLIAVDEAHLICDWGMKGSTWRGREGSTWRGREESM